MDGGGVAIGVAGVGKACMRQMQGKKLEDGKWENARRGSICERMDRCWMMAGCGKPLAESQCAMSMQTQGGGGGGGSSSRLLSLLLFLSL